MCEPPSRASRAQETRPAHDPPSSVETCKHQTFEEIGENANSPSSQVLTTLPVQFRKSLSAAGAQLLMRMPFGTCSGPQMSKVGFQIWELSMFHISYYWPDSLQI